jgi:hypothetical protein
MGNLRPGMTIEILDNQLEVFAIMLAAGITPTDIQPVPPADSCDGITDLWPGAFLVVTNERGAFKLTLIQEATKAEAWEKFDEIRKVHQNGAYKHGKPRAVMIGNGPDPGPLN